MSDITFSDSEENMNMVVCRKEEGLEDRFQHLQAASIIMYHLISEKILPPRILHTSQRVSACLQLATKLWDASTDVVISISNPLVVKNIFFVLILHMGNEALKIF